jgi:AraC-like DNA-binding protein
MTVGGHIDCETIHAGLGKALTLIQREYRRGPSLEELARAAHCSPYHFHRLFRKAYGKTPKRTIIDLKIAEVQRLALNGVRFKDAAEAVGFANQTHMTTTFKRVTGTTPRAWLRMHDGADLRWIHNRALIGAAVPPFVRSRPAARGTSRSRWRSQARPSAHPRSPRRCAGSSTARNFR